MTKGGEKLIKAAKQAVKLAKADIAADRIQELETHVEALQSKIADHDCACSYDQASDICMTHSPVVNNLRSELSGVHAGTHCIVPMVPTDEMVEHAATMRMLQERDVHIVYLEMLKIAQGHGKPISTDLGFMLSASEGDT